MCHLQWYGLDTRGFTTIIQYDTICELLLSGTYAQAVFYQGGGCARWLCEGISPNEPPSLCMGEEEL